jgi:hypothetical protein
MTTILVLGILLAIAALAPRYGRDTRALDDRAWSRDNLWSR